ncbi:MAG: antitoxin [Nakamurella sp.]
MPDVSSRDLPEEVLLAIDARAAKLGVSRDDYLRRRLVHHAHAASVAVTVRDLDEFAELYSYLDDPDLMAGAWD